MADTALAQAIAAAAARPDPTLDPRARPWQERLMNWWQSGAGVSQPQAYDPRTYPPRPGLLPLGRRY